MPPYKMLGIQPVELTGSKAKEGIAVRNINYYARNIELLEDFKETLKSESANNVISIGFLGDSITEGGVSSNHLVNGYASLIRTVLQSKFGNAGEGFISAWRRKNSVPEYAITRGGQWHSNAWDAAVQIKPGGTATYSFDGDAVDVLFWRGGATGTFTITVDDGDPITVQSNQPALMVDQYTVSGLANGEHTVVVTNTDESRDTFFAGFLIRKGSVGVRINNYGFWGAKADRGVNANFRRLYLRNPSDLYVIAYGANDFAGQEALSVYKSRIKTIVESIRGIGSQALIFANGLRNLDLTIDQEYYFQTLYELSDEMQIPLIDANAKWGTFDEAMNKGYFPEGETVHPSDKGHKDLASVFLTYLLN